MKLSKRLQQLAQMVGADYDHIWDCCCDHGHLGLRLLADTNAQIHFVDIVPELITRLTEKLEQYCSDQSERWHTYCMDMSELPLQHMQGRQLVIIAGVGGDLLIQLLDSLMQKNPELDVDFLLCPVYHQYAVRQKLNGLNFSLLDELLIKDKGRFYEALLVSSKSEYQCPVSLVGEKIWQTSTAEQEGIAREYLAKTLSHYRRIAKDKSAATQTVIDCYSQIVIRTGLRTD